AAGGRAAIDPGARVPAAAWGKSTRHGQLVLLDPHPSLPPRGREILKGAACLLLVLLLLAGCTLQPDVSQAAPNGRVGTAAPALSGQTLAGDTLSVDFRQSKTVLVFWA